MGRDNFLYGRFISHIKYDPTPCQDNFFREIALFLTQDDGDIMVLNGYAGTGKTTAISAVTRTLDEFKSPYVLLAPTGRAAKVLSRYSGKNAYTIHKQIYRQKSVNAEGLGQFTLSPNKAKDTLFVVDEVSLIGVDTTARSTAVFGTGNLLEDLITYVRCGNGCKLVLVGDSAQLPPVGHEYSPALDRGYMEGFGGVQWAELKTVVRQQQESGILHNATILRSLVAEDYESGGNVFPLDSVSLCADGFSDIERISGGDLIETIGDAFDKYGEDETVILCRSNKRANRYNIGIRSSVQYKEEMLVRGDKLMIVKNCYQFLGHESKIDYIANGDIASLVSVHNYEERYGLHFADAVLSFPDYDGEEVHAKICIDTLESESASLTYEQQNVLFQGVMEDYSHIITKRKRYEAVKENPYYNALQIKYADAITCHKAQGGQWDCVFIDNPFWQDMYTVDDYKWLYTALTRAVRKVYLVNFNDSCFE